MTSTSSGVVRLDANPEHHAMSVAVPKVLLKSTCQAVVESIWNVPEPPLPVTNPWAVPEPPPPKSAMSVPEPPMLAPTQFKMPMLKNAVGVPEPPEPVMPKMKSRYPETPYNIFGDD